MEARAQRPRWPLDHLAPPVDPAAVHLDDAEPPQLNSRWIEEMMHSANSTGGITLVDEMTDVDA